MKLVTPSSGYEKAFHAFCDDFSKNDPENADYYQASKIDFSGYVQSLFDESKGINLREGVVPCSHFWLTDDEDKLASQKIIKANGGQYVKTVVGTVNKWPIVHFRVECE
ncbi:GNAT family N-acetyltransferase [Grimontia marina]|uniref:Uncharacterized protein n=1 Tax=Grimontia marina TaxID=646534 RepID=A0A128FKI3_9GAMM|nr:hypothetical protein [Grimontia marina]CZF86965.1 hypothetical protein GMA8713_05006 [Grimontia marina]